MGEGGRKKPGPRSDINKLAIRRDYSTGKYSLTELAKVHGVRRQTIAEWVKKEGWATPVELSARVRTEIERQTIEEVASELRPHIAAELLVGARLALKMAQAGEYTVDEFLAGRIKPAEKQNLADVLNALAMGVSRSVALGRDVNGLTDGQPSVKTEGDEEERRVDQAVLVVRPKEQTA